MTARTGTPFIDQIHAVLALVALLASFGQASAALGDVRAPAAAQRSALNVDSFNTREVALETGTVVVEYIDSGGRVFAISWAGPVLPPLDQWLGEYFARFSEVVALGRQASNLGTPLGVSTDKLVAQSRGRMGHFNGHAYVPALVPAGLRMQDVLP